MDAETRFALLADQQFRGRRNGGSTNARIGAFGQIREILQHRELLGLLVRRDLKARYKDSALGFLWSFARPLTQLAIYYIVIGHFLGAARGLPDFGIYIFAGLTAYALFSETVSGGANSILSNAGLVKKVYTPREIYPLASIGGALFNFGIQMIVLLAGTALLGAFPTSWNLLYAIPAFLILLVFASALALLLSVANVFLRDIGYLVEVLLPILMWASPIVYSWTMVADTFGTGSPLLEIYTANPITLGVLGFQKAFWAAGSDAVYPDNLLLRMLIALAVGLVLLAVSHWVFRRTQGNVAQEL